MRMWMITPSLLCREHLLGEHNETHAFVGTINKGKRVDGYLRNNLLEINSLKQRHEELVIEMVKRGYNHKSPLPEIKENNIKNIKIDTNNNIKTLIERCPKCRERIGNCC